MKEKMMIRLFMGLIFCLSITLYSQTERGDIRVMFYNVENLFDCIDDTTKQDDEFLPDGAKKWGYKKYYNKLNKIYKVIAYAGGWEPPEIIGLCETENNRVLGDLINKTPLIKYNYRYVHYESPDIRGIDVACLYNADRLKVIASKPLTVSRPDISHFTRDILYVSFETIQKDTLHIFVNHWTSRRGGREKSESKRMGASAILKHYTDSLLQHNHKNILVIGDFNDEPNDKSTMNLTRETEGMDKLVNVSAKKNSYGTIKFEGKWYLFDQVMVSSNLFNRENPVYTHMECFTIIAPPFLLMKDENHAGEKPFPTFTGMRYTGGFSDHLPVSVDLYFKKK